MSRREKEDTSWKRSLSAILRCVSLLKSKRASVPSAIPGMSGISGWVGHSERMGGLVSKHTQRSQTCQMGGVGGRTKGVLPRLGAIVREGRRAAVGRDMGGTPDVIIVISKCKRSQDAAPRRQSYLNQMLLRIDGVGRQVCSLWTLPKPKLPESCSD